MLQKVLGSHCSPDHYTENSVLRELMHKSHRHPRTRTDTQASAMSMLLAPVRFGFRHLKLCWLLIFREELRSLRFKILKWDSWGTSNSWHIHVLRHERIWKRCTSFAYNPAARRKMGQDEPKDVNPRAHSPTTPNSFPGVLQQCHVYSSCVNKQCGSVAR